MWEDKQVEHYHQIPDKLPTRRKLHDLKADAKVQYDAWKAITPLLNLFYHTLVHHPGACCEPNIDQRGYPIVHSL